MIYEEEVDENSDVNLVCDMVSAKYEMIHKMGRGNYGTVWKAIDKRNRERVAIKKIRNAFANKIDAIRTFREIQIMFEMGRHPNIMAMHTVRIGKNNKDIYLVFDLLDADLHTVIRAGICTDEQRKFILWQLARATLYIHSGNLLHRDIKPANILIN